MIYSIPDTQPANIISCEATENEVIFYLEGRTDRIARKSLVTGTLIENYGPTLAAERLAQSHGTRTYKWVNWQVMPLFGLTAATGALAGLCSASFLIGLVWTVFCGTIQWIIHTSAYESTYRAEDPILFENVDQGLLNLRRIEALDLEELDKVSLKHRTAQVQSLVNAQLVARRTDPTVSEQFINGFIDALFRSDYHSYDY